VLAAIFVFYGASKIPYLADFAQSIENYRILPITFVNAMAITLPWIEVVAGLALLRRKWVPGAIVVIAGMTAVFTAAIVSAIARGLDINCGCLNTGIAGDPQSNLIRQLALDILLLALALHVWWWARLEEEKE
jgi:hypothetical protein